MKVAQYITLDDLPVLDPVELYNRCERLRRRGAHVDTDKFWGKCNSWTYGTGFEPGRGYLLMSGDAVNTLRSSISEASHDLKFGGGETDLHFLDLVIVGAEAILGGPSFSAESAYVVEVADKRILGPLSFVNLDFNVYAYSPVTSSSYDNQYAYFDASRKNGTANWTYAEIVELLWTGISATYNPSKVSPLATIMGVASIDTTEASFTGKTPLNYSFRGISAWDALKKILEDTNHILVLDRDGNFFIKSAFGTDTDLTEAKDSSKKFLINHSQDVNNISHRIPEKIRVLFPSRDPSWWTANSYAVQTVNDYHRHTPYYTKEVSTGVSGAITGTILPIQDSLIANYNEVGTIQNQAACDARAEQIKDDFVAAIQNQSPSQLTYSTARDFECGRQVRALCYADFGDGVKTIVKTDYQHVPVSPLIQQASGGSALSTAPIDYRSALSSKEATLPPQLARYGEVPDRFVVAYIDSALLGSDTGITANGVAQVRVRKGTNTSASVTTWANGGGNGGIIEAWDVMGHYWPAGMHITCWLHPQTRRWVIIGPASPVYGVILGEGLPGFGFLTAGASVTHNIGLTKGSGNSSISGTIAGIKILTAGTYHVSMNAMVYRTAGAWTADLSVAVNDVPNSSIRGYGSGNGGNPVAIVAQGMIDVVFDDDISIYCDAVTGANTALHSHSTLSAVLLRPAII